MWWHVHFLQLVIPVAHQWNRSVNMVLTTIPVGVLAQYAFTLTLPYVLDHTYQLQVVFKPSSDMPWQQPSALLPSVA